MSGRDKAANQLLDYKNSVKDGSSATTAHGVPLIEKDATLTVGPRGPILLQDVAFIEEIAHFDRERIPERVVHAKGAGAFGYFEVTHDITKYTAAKVFANIGKKTPVAVRFSTVGGESGSADTVRDPRGFAVKFYSEDGIWDLVGNNTPIFFIRDPILFPNFIHTQKRNPQTHLKDADMFWDFLSLRPETIHQVMFLFSDRGIPDGYRHMNGYGSHTFKLVNADGKINYCKFHFKTDQGIKNLEVKKADELAGTNPDYSIQDLYNAIAGGKPPSWTFYIQIMTPEQAANSKFNPFDLTKIWPHSDYPLIPVGKMVLNKNPENYFAEVEQIAFSPAHMIPGIEPSPDKMLLGRIFSYGDTHRHRLGANYLQIPVNCPFKVRNFQRDGPQCISNQGGAPNYHPNSFNGPENDSRAKSLAPAFTVSGEALRYDTGEDDNFSQARVFYQKTLDSAAKERLIKNMAGALSGALDFIQERMVKNLNQIDTNLGGKVAEQLNIIKKAKANLGPILLQDIAFIEEIAHFDRERIPERVVHAKGAGAFGYFEVTHDITKYTAAKVFANIGKKTPVAVRFSTVGGESGSADTVRDPRGFAVKFYSEDGIWDLVGNNTPIFFIRDPILFPNFIHTQKRNPQTHLKDADMFWDFLSLRPETIHQVMFLFSDRGIPDGYRHMNGYGSHTFKLVNADGKINYCKFHFKTDQGIKNLDVKKADELAGTNPDYSIQDLYNAIAGGKPPSWTFYIQIMTPEQAANSKFNPFDLTKIWPHSDYPLIPVGKMVLNKNPENYFAEVEQIAFSPAHMIPGIEPSPDKMLLGRIFSYGDTHRHRLGANYLQIPVNCPFKVRNFQRDGPQCISNQGGAPNYHPNSFNGPENDSRAKSLAPAFTVSGEALRYDTGEDDNFSQARVFYQKTLDSAAKERLIKNMAGALSGALDFIQERMVKNLNQIDTNLGGKVAEQLNIIKKAKANL